MDTDSRDTIIWELREENASPMARAQSLGGREAELRRYLADPRLNIDSNPCENVIRPLAWGGGTGSLWGARASSRWPSSPASRPPARRMASTSRSGYRTSFPGLTSTPPPASASFSRMSGGPAGTPHRSRPADAARALANHPHGRLRRQCPRGSGHADPQGLASLGGVGNTAVSPRLRTRRSASFRTEANNTQPCPSLDKCCLNGRLPETVMRPADELSAGLFCPQKTSEGTKIYYHIYVCLGSDEDFQRKIWEKVRLAT